MENMQTNIFDRLAFLSLFLVIVLLPIFFLPFSNIPVETSKSLLLVVGLVASITFWAIARFLDGRVVFPRSSLLLSGLGVVLVFLLSALLSKNPPGSLFGIMLDVGSFWFIFAGFLLMLMSSLVFRTARQAKIVMLGAILSGAVALIFQLLHLFAPQFLSFGVLPAKTDNLLGTWNTLGIFAGFSALMFILVVEFFSINKIERLVLQALTILSLVLVAAVNFAFVWKILGIFVLIIFVYKLAITSRARVGEAGTESVPDKNRFPAFSFIVIIIALLFFISGDTIGGILPNRLGLQNTEVSPALSTTFNITKSVIKESPLLGIGPNKFGPAWALYKPSVINSSPFWDTSFNYGSGWLPTFAATTGILGILSLLAFAVLFTAIGVRSVFSSIKNKTNWETMAFFVLAFYLFVSSFFYAGGSTIFLLALVFAGVYVGLSVSLRGNGEVVITYLEDHKKSFFSILLLILVIVASVALSFKYMERLISASYFGKSLSAVSLPDAEDSIKKAISLYENDLYLRTYSRIYLLKLNSLVQKGDKLTEEEKTDLQSILDQSVDGAQLAARYDPTNYLNFQALGSTYQGLASLGVKDLSEKAIEAYKSASVLNPNNPGLKLAIAGIYFSDGKVQEAKDYGNQALSLKADYIDALVTLSQIAKSEGDNAAALTYAQKALSMSPKNTDLVKYVDSLKNAGTPPAGRSQ